MNKILIAEDEKFIRKGLHTMLQRAPITVDDILEARDGEEAWEIIQNQHIDLLITDVRMPRMDGIELVSRLSNLPDPPLTLVVSGYDDFNYAVAMMRNGVEDYLLKPVERQVFYDIMARIEEKLAVKRQKQRDEQHKYFIALRYFMLEEFKENTHSRQVLSEVEELFPKQSYVGIYTRENLKGPVLEKIMVNEDMTFCLVAEADLSNVLELITQPAGCSRPAKGIMQMRRSFLQAQRAWQRSFFTGKPFAADLEFGTKPPYLAVDRLMGLIRLGKHQEILTQLRQQTEDVKEGLLEPDVYAKLCHAFVKRIEEAYQTLVQADEIAPLKDIFSFKTMEDYLSALETMLTELCQHIAVEFSDFENKQKIREATQYVQQHFAEQLNMAVVSNRVSMNYSLFSLLFKQYTGTNFVSYLQSLRIAEAKRLLEETDWRVNEICRRSGFLDEKHFLKVFKASTGFSPSEYRKSKRLKEYQTQT